MRAKLVPRFQFTLRLYDYFQGFFTKKHEDFKLDYLRIIDKMTSQPKDSINEKK